MAFCDTGSDPAGRASPGPRGGCSRGPGGEILSKEEMGLLAEIEEALAKSESQDLEGIRERFLCLKALGEAAFRFPSVRESQRLMGEKRDESRLIQSLCSFSSPNYLLHIPTKVLAIRSFLVAKFHYFSMLHILADGSVQ
ncbi:MAG: hypothetical protein LBO65_00865, partial [Spirochaetaceae bacterium]|nr:hypothetical protein [Spirochaetaceae bacterium]